MTDAVTNSNGPSKFAIFTGASLITFGAAAVAFGGALHAKSFQTLLLKQHLLVQFATKLLDPRMRYGIMGLGGALATTGLVALIYDRTQKPTTSPAGDTPVAKPTVEEGSDVEEEPVVEEGSDVEEKPVVEEGSDVEEGSEVAEESEVEEEPVVKEESEVEEEDGSDDDLDNPDDGFLGFGFGPSITRSPVAKAATSAAKSVYDAARELGEEFIDAQS